MKPNTPFPGKRAAFVFILIFVFISALKPEMRQEGRDETKLHKLIRHTIPLISVEELHELLENKKAPVLMDTRTEKEYRVSHLKGARFVGYSKFKVDALKDIPRDAEIVVYCSLGVRSEIIGEKLKNAGFKNVRNLIGGIFLWVNRDYRVYDGSGAPTENIHPFNRKWGKWLSKGKKTKTYNSK